MDELGDNAKVTLWTGEFELSASFIESLEKASGETDFAVMVVTPDDVTTSRNKKKPAPRDNVVFELGLFMGCLGRDRCFILSEEGSDLKLPTDLLGVKTAIFKRSVDRDLEAALATSSRLISKRIAKLGNRYKLTPAGLASQTAIRDFCNSVAGAWWDRVRRTY